MRHGRLVVLGIAAVAAGVAFACGGDDSGIGGTDDAGGGGTDSGNTFDGSIANTKDGSNGTDSGNTTDGSMQTDMDSGTDAPVVTIDATAGNVPDASGLTGEIFHYGRFVASNANSFGSFKFPAVTENVLSLGGDDLSAWDVTANGGKILYGVDKTLKGRFDLYTANPDGSGSGVLVALKNAGRSVSAAKFSPDGTMIAFFSDDVTSGAKDVYLVPTNGGTAPILISPVRGDGGAVNKLNADQMAWSRDSKYLAFSGDFDLDNAFELWIYDVNGAQLNQVVNTTDTGTPSTKPVGITNPFSWDNNERLYFTAILDADAASAAFKLYVSDKNGSKQIVPGTNDNSEQCGSFGISPDGNTLAVSLTDSAAGTLYKLYTVPAGGGAKTALISAGYTIANATGNPDFTKPLVFSPDGTKIAFVADYQGMADADYELFVIANAANSTPVRLFKVTTGRDAKWIAWAQNSSRVAFTSDEGAPQGGNARLFLTNDLTTPDQTLAPILLTPSGGGLISAPPQWKN